MINFDCYYDPPEDPPCEICGKDPSCDCDCPECLVCGRTGNPDCYIEHGLQAKDDEQLAHIYAIHDAQVTMRQQWETRK